MLMKRDWTLVSLAIDLNYKKNNISNDTFLQWIANLILVISWTNVNIKSALFVLLLFFFTYLPLLELLFILFMNISTWLLRFFMNSSRSLSTTPFSLFLYLTSLFWIGAVAGADGLAGVFCSFFSLIWRDSQKFLFRYLCNSGFCSSWGVGARSGCSAEKINNTCRLFF